MVIDCVDDVVIVDYLVFYFVYVLMELICVVVNVEIDVFGKVFFCYVIVVI